MFGRLGLAGAILVAAVFVFGVTAGAAVVHRLEIAPIADVQEQGEQDTQDEQGEDKAESNPKHPNHGHGQGHKVESPKKSPDND